MTDDQVLLPIIEASQEEFDRMWSRCAPPAAPLAREIMNSLVLPLSAKGCPTGVIIVTLAQVLAELVSSNTSNHPLPPPIFDTMLSQLMNAMSRSYAASVASYEMKQKVQTNDSGNDQNNSKTIN